MSHNLTRLSDHLFVYHGAINTGILYDGDHVLIIDLGDGSAIKALKPDIAKMSVLFTHHHRDQASGLLSLKKEAEIGVPMLEKAWFEEVDKYWNDPANRWHVYVFHPHSLMLTKPVTVDHVYKGGDAIEFGDARISVIDTPGHTDGSVSYIVEVDGSKFAFSGDVIYDAGRIWELYSMQKGNEFVSDYHGFLGSRNQLKESLNRLKDSDPAALIPSHGNIMYKPAKAIDLLISRLDECYDKYVAISALRYYFPPMFAEFAGSKDHMPIRDGKPVPEYLRHYGTSWLIASEDKDVFVIDCGGSAVTKYILDLQEKGEIRNVTGLWITHYHDDHVDGIPDFLEAFGCPIYADNSVADVLEHPGGFRIPCISHVFAKIDHRTKDGESWLWKEFKMTAYHFPGQTYYHGGLLVEGRGNRLFFAGDSFTVSGIDDYCSGNRNWLGKGVGFDRCLQLIHDIKPSHIFNCHVDPAFDFTDDEISFMRSNLSDREVIYGDLLPWDSPNYGMDEYWIRCFPYEQEVMPEGIAELRVCIMNHSDTDKQVTCRPIAPESWNVETEKMAIIPAKTEGYVRFAFVIPENAKSERIVIPFEITYDGRLLGQFREAIVVVKTESQ